MYDKQSNKDEIDLVDLFLSLWAGKRIIFYSLCVFLILGILVAFTKAEQYTSQLHLIPESGQQNVGVSLAQQFGIRAVPTTTSDGISTKLYPDIASSSPFLLSLLNNKIYYSEINDSISIINYFNDYYTDDTFISKVVDVVKKYTIQLPSTITERFRKEKSNQTSIPVSQQVEQKIPSRRSQNVVDITSRERRAIGRLRSRITVNSGEGIITIIAKMPEGAMAADIVDYTTLSLIKFVKNYRTEKARNDVEFIEERYMEARSRFEASQEHLAKFRDQSRGSLTQIALIEEQRLQSEYELSFNIYNTLARRLEEAKLNLQEETPVVKVLEPALVPTGPSEPRKDFIIILYTFLGIFTGFVLIFLKNLRKKIINTINKK